MDEILDLRTLTSEPECTRTTRSGYLGEGSGVDEITFLYRGKKLWLNKYLSVSCFIIDNY